MGQGMSEDIVRKGMCEGVKEIMQVPATPFSSHFLFPLLRQSPVHVKERGRERERERERDSERDVRKEYEIVR